MRKKEVMIVTGAGQISMAIARRVGYGKKIVMGDKNIKNAKAIAEGGCGVTISSQSGWRMPQLTAEEDAALATTPTEELLNLEILQPENIRDTLHAYQMAKRCNEKRVMAQSVAWGKRGARLNDIAPGIIVTPLAVDEFNGPRGDFYKNMFAKCPAGRPGTADEVANVAELLMSDKGAFITGSTFLIDGGATSSYYYGPLKPENLPVRAFSGTFQQGRAPQAPETFHRPEGCCFEIFKSSKERQSRLHYRSIL